MQSEEFAEVLKRLDAIATDVQDIKLESRVFQAQTIEKLESTNQRIDFTNQRIDSLEKTLNQRIDSLEKTLNQRIDFTNQRIESLEKTTGDRLKELEKDVDMGQASLETRMNAQDTRT